MRITIDNGDGLGPLDYTTAVAPEGPITIRRVLNAPSRCTADVLVMTPGLPCPTRKARVIVERDAGSILFTGYLANEPVMLYVGAGCTGPSYRARITAISDEWLLDKQGSGSGTVTDGLSLGSDGAGLIQQLSQNLQPTEVVSSAVAVPAGSSLRALGAFAVQPAAGWSTNAAAAANASYATYRVLDGAVTVAAADSVSHVFSDADGSFSPSSLSVEHLRELANDITLSGAEEPIAYVQEIFQGDGTTTDFVLSDSAFRGTNRTLLRDSFQGASFDLSQWSLNDSAGHLQLTSAGLTLNGGNGLDGQTTLTSVNATEMGGFVLAELGGVTFGPGSDGTLAGFYSGSLTLASCFAGFRVRQSASTNGGVTVVVPVVNGTEVGSVYTPIQGHRYTLRLRLFCPEIHRVPQRYYCMIDGTVHEFGALGATEAPMQLVFEIRDEGNSSDTVVTVLYDSKSKSPISGTVAACRFVLANSVSMFGSVGSVEMTRPGSLWVTSTLPSGAGVTRLVGQAGEGVDCQVEYGTAAGNPGKISFFAGRIPIAGEQLTVSYRTERRSVARLADAASAAAESTGGGGAVPGVSRWLGKVIAPVARSSADCQAAAQAVLAMATARSAALGGKYTTLNPAADIWPGEVVQISTAGATYSLLTRAVTVQDGHAVPEVVHYSMELANDWATEWADGLGLKLSGSIAADAVLPASAATSPDQTLPNLQSLLLVSLTGTALQVDAGVAAPVGGGFEVRRRDWEFGFGVDGVDLVLRSPVQSFSIPRAAQNERYYVRMYDGSTPPKYSQWSSVLSIHWPVS